MRSIISPTPEQQLILQLARGGDDERRLVRLVGEVDFGRLRDRLAEARLLGLLGLRLLNRAGEQVPAPFAGAVQEILDEGRRRAALQQMVSWGILDALEKHGVRAMPLKGAFWGEWLHGDAGLRLSDDIDILVSPAAMPAAIDAMEALGYLRPPKADRLPSRLHHVMRSRDGLPVVELHWRLHWYESRFAPDMVHRSTVVDRAVRRAAPRDELMALLLFYARDGFVGLRMPVDIAAWWTANGEGVSRPAFAAALERYPELARALRAAAIAASRLLGLSLAESLGVAAAEERRTRLAVRFARLTAVPPGRPEDQAVLVDGLLAPANQLPAFVRRQFWPVLPGHPFRLERGLHAGALAVRTSSLLWRVRDA